MPWPAILLVEVSCQTSATRSFKEIIILARVSIKTAFIVQVVALVVEHAEF